MISRKFVNIGFESRGLAMLHDACIQILEVRGPQDRLRAQGSPQFINGGAGQLKLALPCRLPVACIHVINKRVSGTPRLCTTHRERAFLARSAFERHLAHTCKHNARLALSGNKFDDFRRYLSGFSRKFKTDNQHFWNQFAIRKSSVGRTSQGQHGDGFNLIHKPLLKLAGNRRFAHEQSLRQYALGLRNRCGNRQSQ